MHTRRRALQTLLAALATPAVAQTRASPTRIRIGVLTDLSTGCADWSGCGAVLAGQMAAEDAMASLPGLAVDVVSADHQNKADIASSVARRWLGNEGVDAILDMPNSAAALAVSSLARDANKALVASGSVTDDLTGKACSPNTVQWTIDSWALANGTGCAVVEAGGDSWFFITSDFAGGRSLEAAVSTVVRAAGGKVLGSSYAPIGTTDYAANMLQAQGSGAKIVGLSMSGSDFANAVKQAAEFGIVAGEQKLAGLVVFLTDVKSLGLPATQGLQFTEAFYWDRTDDTRVWSKRFAIRNGGRFPTQIQAGSICRRAALPAGGASLGQRAGWARRGGYNESDAHGRPAVRPRLDPGRRPQDPRPLPLRGKVPG